MAPFTRTASASRSLRVLAALLGYPGAELRRHLGAMRALLHEERALGGERLAELDALIDGLQRGDPLETEAAYVQLFDLSLIHI